VDDEAGESAADPCKHIALFLLDWQFACARIAALLDLVTSERRTPTDEECNKAAVVRELLAFIERKVNSDAHDAQVDAGVCQNIRAQRDANGDFAIVFPCPECAQWEDNYSDNFPPSSGSCQAVLDIV